MGQVAPVGEGAFTEAAFTEAWGGIAAQVSARCRQLAWDVHEAQELYQLTVIRAWRGHATFRGESGYLTWVMRILDREAARLASRRKRMAAREISVDPQAAADEFGADMRENDRISERGAGPDGGGAARSGYGGGEYQDGGNSADGYSGSGEGGWLAALLADAADGQAINATEHQVVAARLTQPAASWAEIAGRLKMTATACAVAHSRAVPKLRVFLFTDRGALIGGDQAIAAAFDRVRRDPGRDPAGALTALEDEAFEHLVIRRSPGYRRRGSQAALRGACAKVARRMGLP